MNSNLCISITVISASLLILVSAVPNAMQPKALMVESENAQLLTTIYQRSNAETVILLHGGPGVPMDFTPIVEQLSRKYQVIAFDQRGTGRSPAKDAKYAIEQYIGDIEVIAQHFGITKFHLWGHSWGGLYAQIYVEKNPQKVLSMFLSSPSSGTGEQWKRTENEVMAFNKKHSTWLGWLKMGIMSGFGMLGSDAAYQALFKQVLENYNREFAPAFIATDALVENVRAEPINKTRARIIEYPLLKSPVEYPFPILVIYGENDIYGDSKRFVRSRFPRAQFIEIEHAGHITWRHNPEKFIHTLINFYQIR